MGINDSRIASEAPTRIIFLDIDGVLHHRDAAPFRHDAAEGEPDGCFLPDCLDRLRRIIDATGAMIVLSSSWRQPSLIGEARTRLAERSLAIYDVTPILEERGAMTASGRSEEINAWLHQNSDLAAAAFIALDDLD